MDNKKERIWYIDLLKLIGSMFVVFMHTASDALWTNPTGYRGWFVLAALSGLSFCAVPLFFMISGYLLSYYPCDVPALLKKRVPKLAGALVFWSALYVLFGLLTAEETDGVSVFRRFYAITQSPVNISLWYMYALIPMYLISPLLFGGLNSLDSYGRRCILALIVILEALSMARIVVPRIYTEYLSFTVFGYLNFFDRHLCSFILGWYLGRKELHCSKKLLIPVALVDLGIIIFGTIRRSMAAQSYDTAFQTQSAGFEVLLAACLFLLARESGIRFSGRAGRVVSLLSAQTLNIYLMHNLLLLMLHRKLVPLSSSAAILCTAVVYAAALAISVLLNRGKALLLKKRG